MGRMFRVLVLEGTPRVGRLDHILASSVSLVEILVSIWYPRKRQAAARKRDDGWEAQLVMGGAAPRRSTIVEFAIGTPVMFGKASIRIYK
jgi:hypothetical protein